jgi:hypothetical protein
VHALGFLTTGKHRFWPGIDCGRRVCKVQQSVTRRSSRRAIIAYPTDLR